MPSVRIGSPEIADNWHRIAPRCTSSATGPASRATVYKEIKEQRLRVRKVGKRTLVPVDEVRVWLKI